MNADYWEQKYQAGDMHWDKGEAPPGLVEFLATHRELERGTVAVPGCGTGHDVLAWSQAGFSVRGFDVAPSAVRLSNRRLEENGADALVSQVDFLRDPAPAKFDYLWEHTLFCAIEPSERDLYAEALRRWLKPGGTYLALNYIVCEPDGPPFPVTRDELWRRFTPHFELIDQWVPRSYPNRCGRELMSWWRRRRVDGDYSRTTR